MKPAYPKDEYSALLLEDFKTIRRIFGIPEKEKIIKSIKKTSTHSVYPPNWSWR